MRCTMIFGGACASSGLCATLILRKRRGGEGCLAQHCLEACASNIYLHGSCLHCQGGVVSCAGMLHGCCDGAFQATTADSLPNLCFCMHVWAANVRTFVCSKTTQVLRSDTILLGALRRVCRGRTLAADTQINISDDGAAHCRTYLQVGCRDRACHAMQCHHSSSAGARHLCRTDGGITCQRAWRSTNVYQPDASLHDCIGICCRANACIFGRFKYCICSKQACWTRSCEH